jgi:small conductance mechanosensitive channel
MAFPHWDDVLAVLVTVGWKFLGLLVYIAAAVLVAWLLRILIRRVVDRIVTGVKRGNDAADTQALLVSPVATARIVQRTRTLGTVLSNIVNVVIAIVTILLCVHFINASIIGSFALLTAALGAGLGFGAQNIVKDVLNGLFMVIEDQLGIGDVVDVGPATGVVEQVGIRITQVRDVNGTLWFVRNGEILRVGNMSHGWSRVIIDLSIPYTADVDEVKQALLAAANKLAATPKWRARILGQAELWGLESIADDALVIRLVMRTRANARDDVSRELRSRVKAAMDAMEVAVPSLESVVATGFDGAMSVYGLHPPRTTPVPVVPPPKRRRRRRGPEN